MKENFNYNNKVCCNIGTILLMFFVFFPLFMQAQSYKVQKGTINYLSYNNGFNGIMLGDSITKIASVKLKYLDGNSRVDDEGCLKYEYSDASWQKLLDSLDIRTIGLRTWGDRIINIYIFFKKKSGSAILGSFMTDYGTFTSRPDDYKDIYSWESSEVKLDLMYDLNVDLGVAIFTSKPLYKLIQLAKVKTPAKTAASVTPVH